MRRLNVLFFLGCCAGHVLAQDGSQLALPSQPTPEVAAIVPKAPELAAKSYVLMDYLTGQVLAQKDAELRVEPASITKVMTSYVISAELKNGKIKRDDQVMISENAWRGGGAGTDGSTSFLPVNQAVPLQDLLYGMIIQSGNDASIALAEHAAGSEALFVQLMNEHAKRLGMTHTHYANAHGLSDPDHYTTALDIARLGRALIRDFPEDYKIYAIKEFTYGGIKQHNRNLLLWRDSTVDGIKTGHHSGAGFCLLASAKRGDMRQIAVVMGAAGEKDRADQIQALLNYGFRFFETHKIYAKSDVVAEPELWKGKDDKAKLGVAEDLMVNIPRGSYPQLKATMDVPKPLLAPLKQGQPVGKLKIALAGNALAEVPLVPLQDHPEAGFFGRLTDSVLLWWRD